VLHSRHQSRHLCVGHRREPMQNCYRTPAPAGLDGLKTPFKSAPHFPLPRPEAATRTRLPPAPADGFR
jgi:hypothetical protein